MIETPDLPGAGVLYREKSPTKIRDYIPLLEKQLVFDSPHTLLIGLSLGGMVALKWAEMRPHLFHQLILINSSSRLNYFFQRIKLHQAFFYPEILLGKTIQTRESAIYRLTCNTRPVNENLIRHWCDIQQKHPVKIANQWRQIIAGANFQLPAKAKLPPVHLLYSTADRLVSEKCSLKLIDFYSATFDKHRWGGHDLPQDDPEWVVSCFTQLMERVKFSITR